MLKTRYLGLFALALAAATPSHAQEKLLIGSTSASSSHYGYFVAVSQLINQKVKGVDASVVETGATVDNLRRLARKQVDLGLVTTNTGFQPIRARAILPASRSIRGCSGSMSPRRRTSSREPIPA